jgi:hypothetical protein
MTAVMSDCDAALQHRRGRLQELAVKSTFFPKLALGGAGRLAMPQLHGRACVLVCNCIRSSEIRRIRPAFPMRFVDPSPGAE